MIEQLEDTLIEMNQQIMNLEDSTPDYGMRLEAKKHFLLGIIKQVDVELQVLNKEYDNLGISLAAELDAMIDFELAQETYNGVMSNMFKH